MQQPSNQFLYIQIYLQIFPYCSSAVFLKLNSDLMKWCSCLKPSSKKIKNKKIKPSSRSLLYYVCLLVAQSCLTICNTLDCSLPRSYIHVISQARILEWLAIPFSRGSSRSRDQTQVSCIAGRLFTVWATREASTMLFIKVWSLEHLWLESLGWDIANTNS